MEAQYMCLRRMKQLDIGMRRSSSQPLTRQHMMVLDIVYLFRKMWLLLAQHWMMIRDMALDLHMCSKRMS